MKTHARISEPGYFPAKWGSILFLAVNLLFIGAIIVLLKFADFSADAAAPDISDETFGAVLASSAMVVTAVQHVSLLMILKALFWSKFRAPWFYYATNVSSVFMLCSVGGPILAILVSRYLHHNRAEFFGVEAEMPPPLPVRPEPVALKESVESARREETPDIAVVLDENQRLKALVADQALRLQERNSR